MSREVVSVEVDNPAGPVRQWEDALSRHVGQVSPDLRDQEIMRCMPGAGGRFQARLEFGGLGDAVLFKTSATPHYLARSLRCKDATLPSPIVLSFQSAGRVRVRQDGRSYVLHPGDWCLWDTLVPVETWAITGAVEFLSVTLSRPTDPELQRLLVAGRATRLDGKIGVSRVLQRTLTEIFGQLGRIPPASGEALRMAVTMMAWEAVREQVAAPPSASTYRDVLMSRAKTYIETHLADPGLAVAAIADSCGISARSIHRAFARDPAGSVSRYIRGRRLSRCADALRDGGEASQRITEICLSWGFNSSSHFSRLFKEQFGVSPRLYRASLALDPVAQR